MTSNMGTQEGPLALQLNGPWGSFVGPALSFMAGAVIRNILHQPAEPYQPPGPPDPEEPELGRQEVAAQLAAFQQAIEALLPQALALPHAIRHHFLQPFHYVRIAAQHYSDEEVELTAPMPPIPGLKFVPLSPRPQWHEWSRRLTHHLRYTLRSHQWHLLTTVAADVDLTVAQALHAAEHNTKLRLCPNASEALEIRATHSDSEEDSDQYF